MFRRTTRTGFGGAVAAMMGLVFGGVFLVGGLWARAATQPLEDGVIVPGEVVDVDVRSDSDGTSYAPVVDYVDPATGETHRLTGSVSSPSRPRIGSVEEVSLRPGDPSSARVVGPAWFPWIFISVGGAVVAMVLSSVIRGFFSSSPASGVDEESMLPIRVIGDDGHVWQIVDSSGTTRAPGFHVDPDDDGRLRYWDGQRWTDDFAPVLFED